MTLRFGPQSEYILADTSVIPIGGGELTRRACKEAGRNLTIGEWREGAYRVTAQLRTEWDGLDIKGGYLQRSAHLPSFTNPSRFYDWFCAQHPELIASNN